MKTFSTLSLFFIGVAALTGCTTGTTETSSTTTSSSPIIPPSAVSSGTPVTMSGYLDTSVTSQVK